MSIVKSFSVGNGDMFYIRHGSDNFTLIDCCIDDENQDRIVNEIKKESKDKGIHRFISTHPDEDHIQGIIFLDEKWKIINFYCVKNEANKKEKTDSFKKYCELRDDEDKAFYISKGCSRRWMNTSNEERGSSGINILWPDTKNADFIEVLDAVKNGESPNNLSPIIQYNCSAKFMWMGDIENDFLSGVIDDIDFEPIDILFAPHHGRDSGKVPHDILEILKPKIIVIGEAPSEYLNYYQGYNTITQNSAGDIIFDVSDGEVDIYVGEESYEVSFLEDKEKTRFDNYIGSFSVEN